QLPPRAPPDGVRALLEAAAAPRAAARPRPRPADGACVELRGGARPLPGRAEGACVDIRGVPPPRRGLTLEPPAGDVHAAGEPDVGELLDVVQEARERARAGRCARDAAVQADRPHTGHT